MSIYETIVHLTLIEKGWSGDKKYRAETADRSAFLLRLSPSPLAQRRQQEFLRTQQAARLGIPMCLPIEIGFSDDQIYTLLSWIEGDDAEQVIGAYSPQQQYRYGLTAGEILKQIHSIPAPEGMEDWAVYFNRKIDRKIQSYENCSLRYENGQILLDYILSHRHLLSNRPQTYQHGDYHAGNMMITSHGELVVIDFDKDSYGDPWEEFNRIVWSVRAAPAFASGMVDGYFSFRVPEDFWSLLALYVATNTLGSLPWAIPFGEEEVATMRRQAADVLSWFDQFRQLVPSWYERPPLPVSLRPIEPSDRDAIINLLTSEQVKQTYMVPDFSSPAEAEPLFLRLVQLSHENGHFVRAICAGERVVGLLNDTEISGTAAELGWAVDPRHQGHGYAGQAVRIAIQQLFSRGFDRITAGAFEDNRASIRVMEKAGMTRTEALETIFYRGKDHVCVFYEIRKKMD